MPNVSDRGGDSLPMRRPQAPSEVRSVGPATTDFLLDVERGLIEKLSMIHKFGRNPDIDTGTAPEEVWNTGGLMPWPTSAAQLDVVSTSANDDGAPTTNTGAQTLTIEGVDADWSPITETVTLNGTSTVATTQSFLRVNRAFVASVGTYHGTNEGDITIVHGVDTLATILTGEGQTQVARYSVPIGYTAFLTDYDISVDSTKSATLVGRAVRAADDTTQPYGHADRTFLQLDGLDGKEVRLMRGAHVFPEKTDIYWTVLAVSANNTSLSVNFSLLLEQA